MDQEFHRIRRLPPYVFAEVNAMKAKARAAGADIIDFGMGNPDSPTPPHIVDKLTETVRNPRTYRYSNSRGIPGLRQANARYRERRFGVDVDAETETIVTLGSKEGLANLSAAICSPGDVILVPNPSYPIHQFGFIIAGASVRNIPVGPAHVLLAGLERAVRHSVPKPTALVLNFPNNPTTAVADLEFYGPIVEICRRHEIWVLSDLAYAEIYFDDAPPPSILQVPGAKDIAVEFTSMSKTYSMAGWRIGIATGNRRLVDALARIKSYLDYGAFTPIQVAAAAALDGPQDCIDEFRDRYRERRDVLVEGLAGAGWGGCRRRRRPCSCGRPCRRRSPISGPWNSPSCSSARQGSRCRRASDSANTATATFASPWSRTVSGPARRSAISRRSSVPSIRPSRRPARSAWPILDHRSARDE